MAFGKQSAVAVVRDGEFGAFVPVLPPMRADERHGALREIMLRILRDAAHVADAIRSNGTVALRGIADVSDPLAAPITITDLQEHFSFRVDGHLMHSFYAYAPPQRADEFDARAQFDLHQLVLRIRELNLFCQQAERDEALGVALQSPTLPPLVDVILVSSAFFAAYFDNMAQMDPFVVTGPTELPHDKAPPSLAQLRETLDKCLLMASDAMLAPDALDELVPNRSWPQLGVEIVRRHEDGEQFAHGVYFPAEYVARLAAGGDPSRMLYFFRDDEGQGG